ncbi:GNAT family N-acetyltransferase [Halobacillus litoralis]|uniref:GNAT family N-acetyltransferase n=1 Tax=Halobacillus litoralis TaxID=45668 RepID=UPI001CFC871F|nr:GNAT family N-acetyltransferase [Halobacillus litoralis]
MRIHPEKCCVSGKAYVIRSAREEDAEQLSEVRMKVDAETDYLDREPGESFMSTEAFKKLILQDSEGGKRLFLVADYEGEIIGFSRCEGSPLRRLSHKVEFGVAVLKKDWGYGVGRNMLETSINWADANGVKKITLNVIETNEKAIALYKRFGFETEGVLKYDKQLSDGRFFHTLLMSRIHPFLPRECNN